jgi:hypothetical protein
MTLAEWKQLTEQERQKLTEQWYAVGQPRQLGILAEEAAKELLAEIRSLPDVNCVSVAEWPKQGVCIVVSTGLKEGEKARDIPEQYETFRVIQAGMADAKRRYWKCWRTVCSEICGWTEDEARVKLGWLDSLLNNHGSVAYYRGALYHFAEVLVHDVAPGLSGLPRVNLRGSIVTALETIDGQPYAVPNERLEYDWDAARQRVAAAFKLVGISWPRSAVRP